MTDTAHLQEQLLELQGKLKKNPHDRWIKKAVTKLETKLGQPHLGAYTHTLSASGFYKAETPEIDTISPEAVQKAEGYTKIELPDIVPPDWARWGDPDDGLRISNKRSFGCHLLQNVQETAEQWINAPEKVAKHYGDVFSPRVFLYAGRRMLDKWFMLPTMQLSAKLPPYTFAPPVLPYNNTEFDLWKELFVKYHFTGAAMLMGGHGKHYSHLAYHAVPWQNKPLFKHHIPTIANHPHWIMPAMNSVYETPQFKTDYFRSSIAQLMNMDIGILAKNEFYVDWEPYAEGRSLKEYLHEREPTANKMLPNFQKDPELKTKG